MARPPRIDGPVVSLRPPEDADVAAWIRAGRDPEVVLGYGERIERSAISAEEAVENLRYLEAKPWGWVIEADREMVGHVVLDEHDAERRDAFVSLGLLHGDLLGRGFGTAALTAVLRWASGPPLGLRTLHLRVAEYNARAIACYRRCGFVEVGREEAAFELDGAPVADLVMRRTLS